MKNHAHLVRKLLRLRNLRAEAYCLSLAEPEWAAGPGRPTCWRLDSGREPRKINLKAKFLNLEVRMFGTWLAPTVTYLALGCSIYGLFMSFGIRPWPSGFPVFQLYFPIRFISGTWIYPSLVCDLAAAQLFQFSSPSSGLPLPNCRLMKLIRGFSRASGYFLLRGFQCR